MDCRSLTRAAASRIACLLSLDSCTRVVRVRVSAGVREGLWLIAAQGRGQRGRAPEHLATLSSEVGRAAAAASILWILWHRGAGWTQAGGRLEAGARAQPAGATPPWASAP